MLFLLDVQERDNSEAAAKGKHARRTAKPLPFSPKNRLSLDDSRFSVFVPQSEFGALDPFVGPIVVLDE